METTKGKVSWINITEPNEADIEWLETKYHLHPVILEELREPSSRARVERFDHYVYLVYHFPLYDTKEKVSKRSEVDLIITKNEVITVHYDSLEALTDFHKRLQEKNFRDVALSSTLQLSYALLQTFFDFHKRQLSHIREKVEVISAELFHDKEKKILTNISYVKRDLSEYRIIIRPQEHLLKSLLENGTDFWGKGSGVYLSDLLGEYLKIINQIEDYRQAVQDHEETNRELMNIKTKEVMRTFTILSFLTFPFMLFTTLFSMNVSGTPLVGSPYGFWVIVGIVVAGMLFMAAFFKVKKLL